MITAGYLATAVGLGVSAGINAWATLLVFGFMARLQPTWFPGETAAFFASTPVLITIGVIYLIEFVADKVPTVDHVWDAIQTFVRPAAGAVVAWASAGEGIPQHWLVIAAVAGGTMALGSHVGKSTTRLASTAGTGGLANPILSLIEDVFAIVQAVLAILFPFVALAIVAVFLLFLMTLFLRRRRPA